MRSPVNLLKWIVLLLLLSLVTSAAAQDASSIPVHFTGRIERVDNGSVVVNQIVIDTRRAVVNTPLEIGNVVVIDGFLQNDGTLAAASISAYTPTQVPASPTITLAPASLPTTIPRLAPTTIPILVPPAAPAATLPTAIPQVIQNSLLSGKIQAINQNVLTVNGQLVIVRADDPVLRVLQIGDQVVITAQSANGLGTVVSITKSEPAPASEIVIEGLIQEVQGTTFIVNNVPLQLPSDNALLRALRSGDQVRIEGSYLQSPAGLVFDIFSLTVITQANGSQDQENDDEQGDSNGRTGMGNGKGMGD